MHILQLGKANHSAAEHRRSAMLLSVCGRRREAPVAGTKWTNGPFFFCCSALGTLVSD